jgi:hypothetical protein
MATKKLVPPKDSTPIEPELPAGVLDSDLKYPKGGHVVAHITMYHTTGFGWVITCLPIANNRAGYAQRTYAIAIKGAEMCRVGAGPHVSRQITLYLTEARSAKLKYLLDLQREGQIKANQIRDHRATRRARNDLFRSMKGW